MSIKTHTEKIIDFFDYVIDQILCSQDDCVKSEINLENASNLILIIYTIINFGFKPKSNLGQMIQKVAFVELKNRYIFLTFYKPRDFTSLYAYKDEQYFDWIFSFLNDNIVSSVLGNISSDHNLLKLIQLINDRENYEILSILRNEDACSHIINTLEEKLENYEFTFTNSSDAIREGVNKWVAFEWNFEYFENIKTKPVKVMRDLTDGFNMYINFIENIDIYKSEVSSQQEDISKSRNNSLKLSGYSQDLNRSLEGIKAFSDIDSGFGYEEQLINLINKVKAEILSPDLTTKEKARLVIILTELRWKIFIRKNSEGANPTNLHSSDHHFISGMGDAEKDYYSRKEFCEVCRKKIFGRIQKIVSCSNCYIIMHSSCFKMLSTECLYGKLDSLIINHKISPEIGLSEQEFRCGSCNSYLPKLGLNRAKKCDYTGLYYCCKCHIGDYHAVPARMLQNWDFNIYPVDFLPSIKVCKETFSLLEMIWSKRIIRLSNICPNLIGAMPVLNKIHKIRKSLSELMFYVTKCPNAKNMNFIST
ncbi:hypothetical protein HZS_7282, partial [Henneguya salminicola]